MPRDVLPAPRGESFSVRERLRRSRVFRKSWARVPLAWRQAITRRWARPDLGQIERAQTHAILQRAAKDAHRALDWAGEAVSWRSVLGEFPELASAPAFAGLAKAHRELGEWAEAEEACSRGLATFPRHSSLALEVAELAALQRDWKRAVAAWRPMSRADRALSNVSRQIAGTMFRMLEGDDVDAFLEHRGTVTPRLRERCRLALDGILQLRTGDWLAAEKTWDGYRAKAAAGEFDFDSGPIPIRDHPSAPAAFPVAEPKRIASYGALDRPVCVYTALFGDHDRLRPPAYIPEGVDFLCFSDRPRDVSGWKVILRDPEMGDPVLDNRRLKILPFDELRAYAASLYVDANTLFLGDPLLFFQRWLTGSPFLAWRHPERSDLYSECEAVLVSGRHEPRAVIDLYRRLREQSFPTRDGLVEASALGRVHPDAKVEAFCRKWWETFLEFPRRDQLSFPYAVRQTGIVPHVLPERMGTSRDNELFVKIPREGEVPSGTSPSTRPGRAAITDLVFVYHSEHQDVASTIMRGRQLSEIAGRSVEDSWSVHYVDEHQIGEIQNAVVVLNKGFCKTASPETLERLQRWGNVVCADYVDDPIDPEVADAADLLVSSSLRQHEALLREGREAALITHHVDPRIVGIRAQTGYLSLGYFGEFGNARYGSRLMEHIDFCHINSKHPDMHWVDRLRHSNAHYAIRSRRPYDGFKPFLKGFTAAHCGANLIVNRLEGDAVYYLTTSYPYLLEDDSLESVLDMIERMRDSFGSAEWLEGLEIMKSVRARSSEAQVGREIRALLAQAVA